MRSLDSRLEIRTDTDGVLSEEGEDINADDLANHGLAILQFAKHACSSRVVRLVSEMQGPMDRLCNQIL